MVLESPREPQMVLEGCLGVSPKAPQRGLKLIPLDNQVQIEQPDSLSDAITMKASPDVGVLSLFTVWIGVLKPDFAVPDPLVRNRYGRKRYEYGRHGTCSIYINQVLALTHVYY